MTGTSVFERNSFEDEFFWLGVLGLPELLEETVAEQMLFTDDPMEFEANLDQWWPDFISDFCL